GPATVTATFDCAGGAVEVVVGGGVVLVTPLAQFASKFPVHVSFTVTDVGGALSPRSSVIRNCGSPFAELRLSPVRFAVPVASSCTGAAVSGLPLGSANVTDPWAFAGLTICSDV